MPGIIGDANLRYNSSVLPQDTRVIWILFSNDQSKLKFVGFIKILHREDIAYAV
jgi:hypothetical protein